MTARPLAALGLLAVALSGCVRDYQRPAPAEPHAILKLRRVYETRPGDKLSETLLVEGAVAYSRRHGLDDLADAPLADAILVRPVPATLTFRAKFIDDVLTKNSKGQLETLEVDVGVCFLTLAFAPEAGHAYVVDVTYRDNWVCDATCLEQVGPRTGGPFESRLCPPAPSTDGGTPGAGR